MINTEVHLLIQEWNNSDQIYLRKKEMNSEINSYKFIYFGR